MKAGDGDWLPLTGSADGRVIQCVRQLKKEIGRRVRRLRRVPQDRVVMTIAELAKRSGLSEDYVNKLELGRHLPSIDRLVRVAAALGVSVAELIPEPSRYTARSEALQELRVVVTQYTPAQIRYLAKLIPVLMTYPRTRRS